MGGVGSGGMRVGSGRKARGARVLSLEGGRARKKVVAAAVPDVARAPVPAPADLSPESLAVWEALAPHALSAGTLTPGTAAAFRDLCEVRAFTQRLKSRLESDGETFVKVSVDGAGVEHQELKAHPLLARHAAMLVRVEAGMTRFRLSPIGKEIEIATKPDDPFEQFET